MEILKTAEFMLTNANSSVCWLRSLLICISVRFHLLHFQFWPPSVSQFLAGTWREGDAVGAEGEEGGREGEGKGSELAPPALVLLAAWGRQQIARIKQTVNFLIWTLPLTGHGDGRNPNAPLLSGEKKKKKELKPYSRNIEML